MKEVFSIIMLIWGLTAQAQQISVKSFRALPNDLDARASYPKEDKNGEKAAIIKIVTNETGFEFDAGVIGIVASVQKTGEIWLYVPHGSKALTIKHPKFTLLRNYSYPQTIESGEVYEMILVTGRVVTTVEEPVVETQWLIITSDPAEADLYINDQPAGKTPYQNELPVGKYTWRVSKELYLPEAGVADLITGRDKLVMNVKMKPNFGTLTISSSPEEDATVSLDGISSEKITPCTIDKVPTGDHSISVSRDMYETTTQHVTVEAGEAKHVTVYMNPTFAQVTVTSEPAADIYVNGQLKSNSTWQGRLNPGVYTFEARLEKYTTATEQQTVIVGHPLNVNLTPTPKTGSLKIITTPYNATIKIDGKDVGKSPITIKNKLIGDYSVELSLQGYATSNQKVTITQGETAEINIKLQNTVMQVEKAPAPSVSNLSVDSKNVVKKTSTKSISSTTSVFNIEMVFVQGGTFKMGSFNRESESNEKPVHNVTLSDFSIGKYPVTQKQWQAIMDDNPSFFKDCDNCPVENVSWNDIQDFLQKLNHKTGKNYRLPTEAEWEYAAMGGNKSRGFRFSGSNSIDDVAWYNHNSGYKTHPVGQKQSNELGLFDMSGNVWEWCSDWYGADYYQIKPTTNPQGPSAGPDRVNRGGSWRSDPQYCRPSYRGYYTPGERRTNLGFRLVLVP